MDRVNEPPRTPPAAGEPEPEPKRELIFPPTPKATAWVGNELKTSVTVYGQHIEIVCKPQTEDQSDEVGSSDTYSVVIMLDACQISSVELMHRAYIGKEQRDPYTITRVTMCNGQKYTTYVEPKAIYSAIQIAHDYRARQISRSIKEDAQEMKGIFQEVLSTIQTASPKAVYRSPNAKPTATVKLTIEAESREQLEALLQRAAIALDHLNTGNDTLGMPQWQGSVFCTPPTPPEDPDL